MDNIGYWKGKAISDLPRDELLEVVEFMSSEIMRYQKILEMNSIKDVYYKTLVNEALSK